MPTMHTIRKREGGTQEVELTPKESIKYFCKECTNWEEKETRDCGGSKLAYGGSCYLFHHNPYDSSGNVSSLPKQSPLKSIKAECLFCQSGEESFVKDCDSPICTLYPYRLGKDPDLAGKGQGNPAALKAWRDSQNAARVEED